MRPCLDRVAVRATDDALEDLALSLRDALCVTDVQSLIGLNVIEVEGSGMSAEATVNASVLQFVGVEPATDTGCTLIRFGIDARTVLRIGQASLSPCFCLHRVIRSLARLPVRFEDFVGITFAPSPGRFALTKSLLFSVHNWIVTVFYPCKPDIFEATYEPV
jgi:hypothetical protein